MGMLSSLCVPFGGLSKFLPGKAFVTLATLIWFLPSVHFLAVSFKYTFNPATVTPPDWYDFGKLSLTWVVYGRPKFPLLIHLFLVEICAANAVEFTPELRTSKQEPVQ